jgi:MFS family permease
MDEHISFSEYAELYCEKENILTVISSMSYLGSFLGFFIFPAISDNKGRMFSHNIAWFIATLGTILMALSLGSNSEIIMLIGYFLAGFGANPAITLHY